MKPVLRQVVSYSRPHFIYVLIGLVFGAIASFLVLKNSPEIYEAQGSFVINELPFGIREDTTSPDAETSRQFVQSLVLSVTGQEMRHQVARDLGIDPNDLAFADHDIPITLSGKNIHQANITMTVSRNSRSVIITADTTDRNFGVKTIQCILDELKILNDISGRLENINFRLKLNREEITALLQEFSAVTEDRVKAQTQVSALDEYVQKHWSLEGFPGFASDPTLSNLKTQMILVKSEYASLSAEGTGGERLRGKKGEMNNLEDQIESLTDSLSKATRTSLEIAIQRETSLRTQLQALEASNSRLDQLRGTLSKGLGDFEMVRNLDKTDPDLKGEASVILVVDEAFSVPKPIWPKPSLIYPVGVICGCLVGLGLSFLIMQWKYGFFSS